MLPRRRSSHWGMLTFGVLSFSSAIAQTPTKSAAAPVSDAEKLSESKAIIARMRSGWSQVLGKLQEAKASQDVLKLNCVSDILVSLRALLRITEQANLTLQEAVTRNDPSAVRHEYMKVSIADGKGGQLVADAEQCIGAPTFHTDESVTVDVSPPQDLPPDDLTTPVDVPPAFVRPLPASPT